MDLAGIEWKGVAAVAAVTIGLLSFIPYFRSIFRKETMPHAYTWLIWSITQGTAAAGVFAGGGGLIGIGLGVSAVLIFIIFLLSLRYGTPNITRSDGVVLAAAIAAVFVWWQLHEPVLAVLMVCVIDGLGYIPTFRKSFIEPWSENLTSWITFCVAYVFSLIALESYNLLTLPYIVMCLGINLCLIGMLLIRRSVVPKPITV